VSSQTPIRAIVSRFSYSVSRGASEKVIAVRDFEFCGIISVGRDPQYFSGLPKEKQDWFSSSDIRGGNYQGVQWDDIAPLDEQLIEDMRQCESVFMDMVYRLEWKKMVSYQERLRMYYLHLRYWNDYLERHSINLYLSAWIPHEIPDIVIYHLCKLKNIPVLYYHTSTVRDISFAEHDIKDSAIHLGKRYTELLKQYADVVNPLDISLSEPFASCFDALTSPEGQKPPLESFRHQTYWQRIFDYIKHNPFQSLRYTLQYVLTPRGWLRAISNMQRRRVISDREKYYKAHAVQPNLAKQYIYFPLHFQPEASTTPMGGVFGDQLLAISLLSTHLPDGVNIYVKEHYKPSSWICRTTDFYEELLRLPNVHLISMNSDTFALREHCTAVATVTGSAGFEALFRGKPVFLFGHRYYQYARGVFRIYSKQDMATAIRSVFEEHSKHSLIDVRLFLKAMEETGVRGVLNPWHLKVSALQDADHIQSHVDSILQEINLLFGKE